MEHILVSSSERLGSWVTSSVKNIQVDHRPEGEVPYVSTVFLLSREVRIYQGKSLRVKKTNVNVRVLACLSSRNADYGFLYVCYTVLNFMYSFRKTR